MQPQEKKVAASNLWKRRLPEARKKTASNPTTAKRKTHTDHRHHAGKTEPPARLTAAAARLPPARRAYPQKPPGRPLTRKALSGKGHPRPAQIIDDEANEKRATAMAARFEVRVFTLPAVLGSLLPAAAASGTDRDADHTHAPESQRGGFGNGSADVNVVKHGVETALTHLCVRDVLKP